MERVERASRGLHVHVVVAQSLVPHAAAPVSLDDYATELMRRSAAVVQRLRSGSIELAPLQHTVARDRRSYQSLIGPFRIPGLRILADRERAGRLSAAVRACSLKPFPLIGFLSIAQLGIDANILAGSWHGSDGGSHKRASSGFC